MESINGNFNGKDLFREKLQHVLDNYKITLKTLSKVTGIDYDWLVDYVNCKSNYNDLPLIERSSLFRIIIMMSDGIPMTSHDERVKAVIDVLVDMFQIKLETLAIYAGLEIEDVESFMNDINSISYEKRYKLSTVALMLHYLFKKSIK